MSALTPEDRIKLGRMVINVMDEWGIKGADQVAILALPEGMPARKLQYGIPRISLIPGITRMVLAGQPGNP